MSVVSYGNETFYKKAREVVSRTSRSDGTSPSEDWEEETTELFPTETEISASLDDAVLLAEPADEDEEDIPVEAPKIDTRPLGLELYDLSAGSDFAKFVSPDELGRIQALISDRNNMSVDQLIALANRSRRYKMENGINLPQPPANTPPPPVPPQATRTLDPGQPGAVKANVRVVPTIPPDPGATGSFPLPQPRRGPVERKMTDKYDDDGNGEDPKKGMPSWLPWVVMMGVMIPIIAAIILGGLAALVGWFNAPDTAQATPVEASVPAPAPTTTAETDVVTDEVASSADAATSGTADGTPVEYVTAPTADGQTLDWQISLRTEDPYVRLVHLDQRWEVRITGVDPVSRRVTGKMRGGKEGPVPFHCLSIPNGTRADTLLSATADCPKRLYRGSAH